MFDATPTPWGESKLRLADPLYLLANMDAVIHCLKPAVDRSGGEWRIGDIIALILQSNMQLWCSERDGNIEACGVTQLQNWPGLSALTLIFVGGKHRHNWLSFEPDFIQWAKSKNCSEMRAITARKGWEPEMIERGWSEAFVIWRKPI